MSNLKTYAQMAKASPVKKRNMEDLASTQSGSAKLKLTQETKEDKSALADSKKLWTKLFAQYAELTDVLEQVKSYQENSDDKYSMAYTKKQEIEFAKHSKAASSLFSSLYGKNESVALSYLNKFKAQCFKLDYRGMIGLLVLTN